MQHSENKRLKLLLKAAYSILLTLTDDDKPLKQLVGNNFSETIH